MVRPTLLEVENFRSFKERATVRFPERGALLVSGKYDASSASSGSGKSSLLMAMAYALGFCSIPATDLKSWGAKNLYVRLILTDGQHEYEIVRDPKLKIFGPGIAVDGTAAEEWLIKFLNTTPDFAKVLTYRPQREPGIFLNATDSEKKEMLSKLLGLSKLEEAYDRIKAQLNTAASEILQVQQTLEFVQAQLPQLTVDEAQYASLVATYYQAKSQYDLLFSRERSDVVASLVAELNDIRAAMAQHTAMVDAAIRARSDLASLQQSMQAAQAQIDAAKAGKCPTCHQDWGSVEEYVARLKSHIVASQQKEIELNAIIKNAEPVQQAIPKLQDTERSLLSKLAEMNAPEGAARTALAAAHSALDQAHKRKEAYEAALLKHKTLSEKYSALVANHAILSHAEKILSREGFLSVIFDEVLLEIEQRINDMMVDIPNVAEFSVSVSSVQTTKSGNLKKSIAISLYRDGREVTKKSLSGGQQCALELCADLAISESIRKRSGSQLGWVALDESMDGLDVQTKRHALEAIKRRIGGLLILVDHSTEIKEMFESAVDIRFDGRWSKIL
jgi:DNA repair exonuclease SbcCD ATPase subunit